MTTTTNAKKKTAAAADALTPGALKPELEALLAQLRAGLTPGASAATKQEAATVCSVLLAALGTRPGQPFAMPGMAAPVVPPPTSAATSTPTTSAPVTPAAPAAAPPNLLDLVTTWARNNLDLSEPPHQQVPYVGTSEVMAMVGTLGAVFNGGGVP
jgi:hypothetical protein